MTRCEGRKGAAVLRYKDRMKVTKDIVKSMPYKDKRIVAAVYKTVSGIEIDKINGCEGMEPIPESVRIVGKHGDMYQVVWGNSNELVEVGRDELSASLDSYFGESRDAKNAERPTEGLVEEATTGEYEEDR